MLAHSVGYTEEESLTLRQVLRVAPKSICTEETQKDSKQFNGTEYRYSYAFRFLCIKQKRCPEQPILGLMADESAELTENANLGS